MKERITREQWFEITDVERAIFLRGVDGLPDEHIVGIGLLLPLPDIGKMIWFLAERTKDREWLHIETRPDRDGWRVQCRGVEFDRWEKPELADALWEAVKVVLRLLPGGSAE